MRRFLDWLLTIRAIDEDELRRGRTLIIITVGLFAAMFGFYPMTIFLAPNPLYGLVTLSVMNLLYLVVIALTRQGYIGIGGWLFIGMSSVAVLASIPTNREDITATPFFLIVSVVVGGLVLRAWQIPLVALANLLAFMAVALLTLPAATLQTRTTQATLAGSVLLLIIIMLISFLSARMFERTLQQVIQTRSVALQSALLLDQNNSVLEQQVAARTDDLRRALVDVEARAAEQARLLAENAQQRIAIRELSVPVLPLNTSTLVMPLIGALDTQRLQDVQEQALHAIERTAAKRLLLDITGVPVVDTQVARGLLDVVGAARLLGAEVALVGVRPEVAQTVVTLGLDLRGVRTFADVQDALR